MPNSWGGLTAFEEQALELFERLVKQSQYQYFIWGIFLFRVDQENGDITMYDDTSNTWKAREKAQ